MRAGRRFDGTHPRAQHFEEPTEAVIVAFETGSSAHVAIRHRTLHRPRKSGANAKVTAVLGADERLTRQGSRALMIGMMKAISRDRWRDLHVWKKCMRFHLQADLDRKRLMCCRYRLYFIVYTILYSTLLGRWSTWTRYTSTVDVYIGYSH